MSKDKKLIPDEKVECQVCLKEVPVSEAKSEEARDYVVYFCGLECYAKWQGQNSNNNEFPRK